MPLRKYLNHLLNLSRWTSERVSNTMIVCLYMFVQHFSIFCWSSKCFVSGLQLLCLLIKKDTTDRLVVSMWCALGPRNTRCTLFNGNQPRRVGEPFSLTWDIDEAWYGQISSLNLLSKCMVSHQKLTSELWCSGVGPSRFQNLSYKH